MFEVNGTYANRNGNYTVLKFEGRKMRVRYEDGSEASLNVGIQERIWENIVAERDAEAAKSGSKKRSAASANISHYIKTLSISEENDLNIPGLRQRVTAAAREVELKRGDRLIYFAVEPQLFFAVATITAKPKVGRAKDYMFGTDPKAKIHVYPIDVDAHVIVVAAAVSVDATDLESLPNHREILGQPDQILKINEDDFELLAELIAEVSESAEDEVSDETNAEEELELELDE